MEQVQGTLSPSFKNHVRDYLDNHLNKNFSIITFYGVEEFSSIDKSLEQVNDEKLQVKDEHRADESNWKKKSNLYYRRSIITNEEDERVGELYEITNLMDPEDNLENGEVCVPIYLSNEKYYERRNPKTVIREYIKNYIYEVGEKTIEGEGVTPKTVSSRNNLKIPKKKTKYGKNLYRVMSLNLSDGVTVSKYPLIKDSGYDVGPGPISEDETKYDTSGLHGYLYHFSYGNNNFYFMTRPY